MNVLRDFFCEYEPCCRLVTVRAELDQRTKYCSKRCKHLAADQRYRERRRATAFQPSTERTEGP